MRFVGLMWVLLGCCGALRGEQVAQWDFNASLASSTDGPVLGLGFAAPAAAAQVVFAPEAIEHLRQGRARYRVVLENDLG